MNNTRHVIVYATDENYWRHTFISLFSLVYNNRTLPLDIRILSEKADPGISEEARCLQQLQPTICISSIPVDHYLIDNLPPQVFPHVSCATYYRLLLGRLLPDVDRILFLDSDTIVRGSIDPLLAVDIDNCVLAAVPEPGDTGEKPIAETRLGLPKAAPYFNAGVLRINLDRWRKRRVQQRCFEYLSQNARHLTYLEQDALNMVLMEEWAPISASFNYSYEHAISRETGSQPFDPVIVHYTGAAKPWCYTSRHPYRADYWHYRAHTPYALYPDFAYYHVREQLHNAYNAVRAIVRKMPLGRAIIRTAKKILYRRS